MANETEVRQAIQSRAYELWQAGGSQHGKDQEYWSAAEQEVKASLESSTVVSITENQPESNPVSKKPAKKATKKSKVAMR
jgi:hypothetical protein